MRALRGSATLGVSALTRHSGPFLYHFFTVSLPFFTAFGPHHHQLRCG